MRHGAGAANDQKYVSLTELRIVQWIQLCLRNKMHMRMLIKKMMMKQLVDMVGDKESNARNNNQSFSIQRDIFYSIFHLLYTHLSCII